MTSTRSTTSVSLGVQRQIDLLCERFEQQWKDGRVPRLEEYVAAGGTDWRNDLLRELITIELHYRTKESEHALARSQICELHPSLATEIAQQLRFLHDPDGARDLTGRATSRPQVPSGDPESTVEHRVHRRPSRALHIRCPHCSNAVELVSDTECENIICRTCGSAFSLVDREEHTAHAPALQKLGRFEIVARVGVGGFGTVWKARDTELDRVVAIKIPRRGQLDREEIEQFVREARAAAQLRHSSIVSVHEVGRDGETVFIVSDFIRGVSLSDWLTNDLPSFREVCELMVTIADAVHHAHQCGVIHRDLKPSNIIVDDQGQPFVMDFGLAKREGVELTMTLDGQVLGTPAYMSPEQAKGDNSWTDRRTDVYSLGVVLFRMLTNELPFRGNAQMQIHLRLTTDAPDPRSLNRFVPRDLATICLKCLELDASRRYSTAKELAEELMRYLRGEPVLARPISRIERGIRFAKRKPLLTTTAALVCFLAIAGPLVALHVAGQRNRLETLLAENSNLIDRYKVESQHAAGERTEMRRRLQAWEGQLNPWEYWPPIRDGSPRQHLVASMFAQANAKLANPLSDNRFDRETTARGYLGLAMLADANASPIEAREYYEMARDQLVMLREENPQDVRFNTALAECYSQLARLKVKDDRKEAAANLDAAIEIFRELALQDSAHPMHQVDWLESEMASATIAGFEGGKTHLSQADKIFRSLSTVWPVSPDSVYQLACHLVNRTPTLLLPTAPNPRIDLHIDSDDPSE
jgi:serine/threonine protein kinase/ribosomal protein S27E